MRWVAVVVTATVLLAPVAHADPVAPQPGTPCGDGLTDALTQLPDQVFLECRGGTWEPLTGPFPASDKWFSYGPAVKLHGQGMRNPEILSGKWLATPQESGSACTATQAAVVSAGQVGPAQTSTGEPGQPLDFEVLPVVFNIELSGDCLWERVG